MIKNYINILRRSNSPETNVPAGSPSVTVVRNKTVILKGQVDDAGETPAEDWYGRTSLKELDSGVWVMIYVSATAHHINDEQRLRIRFSDDYGETWTAEDTYLDGSAVTGFPMYPANAAPGDPDGPGEPWLYLAPNGDLVVHMWSVDYGTTKYGTYQSRSTDNGKTWSAPELVDFVGIADDLQIYATDDDFVKDGVIYAGGRWYLATEQTDGIKSIFIKSTDNGATWEYISDITNFSPNPTNEVGFEYIDNNTIVAICRGTDSTANGGPYKVTYLTKSTDMGQTWAALTTPANLQVTGRHRIKSRSHVKGKNNWWLDPLLIAHGFEQMNPPNSTQRRNGIWVSKDFGDTWSDTIFLDVTGYDGGYGDFLYNPVKDEYVSLQYWSESSHFDGRIRQYNFKLNWS